MRFTRWAGIACLLLLLVSVTVRVMQPGSSPQGPSSIDGAPAAAVTASTAPRPSSEPGQGAAPEQAIALHAMRVAMGTPAPTALRGDGRQRSLGASRSRNVAATTSPAASRAPSAGADPALVTTRTDPAPVIAQPASLPSAPSPSGTSSVSPSDTRAAPAGPVGTGSGSPQDGATEPTPSPTPRTRTVWSCPDGGELTGTLCVTTRPYTFHEESADYTFHEESTPYTFHREVRFGQPCSYLPNPSAPGGLDIYCTRYEIEVRDAIPSGWSDSGSAWVRQVRDHTPAGWTDTGGHWTRTVKDDAPAGFVDDGSAWRRVEPATRHEVPA